MFGDKSAPDVAIAALHFLADLGRGDYPEAAGVLHMAAYMDDIIFSTQSSKQANTVMDGVAKILALGFFEVKKWETLHFLPGEEPVVRPPSRVKSGFKDSGTAPKAGMRNSRVTRSRHGKRPSVCTPIAPVSASIDGLDQSLGTSTSSVTPAGMPTGLQLGPYRAACEFSSAPSLKWPP